MPSIEECASYFLPRWWLVIAVVLTGCGNYSCEKEVLCFIERTLFGDDVMCNGNITILIGLGGAVSPPVKLIIL